MPTKLVCFTRSTPDIHRLPAVYSSGMAGYTTDEHNKLIKKVVHEDLNKVYLCKLSGVLSDRAFKGHLQTFAERIEKKIMILVSICKYLSVV